MTFTLLQRNHFKIFLKELTELVWQTGWGGVYTTPFITKNGKLLMCFPFHLHNHGKLLKMQICEKWCIIHVRVVFLYKVTSPTTGLACTMLHFKAFLRIRVNGNHFDSIISVSGCVNIHSLVECALVIRSFSMCILSIQYACVQMCYYYVFYFYFVLCQVWRNCLCVCLCLSVYMCWSLKYVSVCLLHRTLTTVFFEARVLLFDDLSLSPSLLH